MRVRVRVWVRVRVRVRATRVRVRVRIRARLVRHRAHMAPPRHSHRRSTEDARRIPGIGPACAALVDDAFRRLRAAASHTRPPRAPHAASPNLQTAGKRKRGASSDVLAMPLRVRMLPEER